VTDDPLVDMHFRKRLDPFVTTGLPGPHSAEGVILTRVDHSRACGMETTPGWEHLDREILLTVPGKDCVAAISRCSRVAVLAALKHDVDLYWMVDYLAEIIPGHFLGEDSVTIHASAVDTGSGAVAFAGDPGVGKTTLAVYLAELGGCVFLADDKLLLKPDESGVVQAQPLYTDVHFPPKTLCLVPGLDERIVTSRRGRDIGGNLVAQDPEEEQEFRMTTAELWPARKAVPIPIRALLFPTLAANRAVSRVVPLSADRASQSLSSLVLPFFCDHWPSVLERDRNMLAKVLERCRCWRIYVGSDLAGLDELVQDAVQEA